jgi:uncharacterized membrane protein
LAKKDAGESKLFAFLAILLGIIGFVLVFLVRRNDRYAMYYAKQSLVLFVAGIIISIVSIVPILGWIAYVVGMIWLVITWLIGLVYSLSGSEKPLPIIGKYAASIKL